MYDITRQFPQTLIDLLSRQDKQNSFKPIFLGGSSGSNGGGGGNPGGFIGRLPQTRVCYDTTEAASSGSLVSGSIPSLVDNLNRIRYYDRHMWSSQSQNLVYASPDGVAGFMSPRALVASDFPVLPIAKGGTAATTATGAINNLLPSQASQGGNVLGTDGANTSWVVGGSGSGGGTIVIANFPCGAMMDWPADSVPQGWLECDGSAVSRTTYSDLFAVIGTTYGSSGSTTFNLPNIKSRTSVGRGQGAGLTDRVLAATGGEETHVLTEAEMPSHVHTTLVATNAVEAGYTAKIVIPDSPATDYETGPTGGDDPHENMPPFIVLVKLIKYTNASAGDLIFNDGAYPEDVSIVSSATGDDVYASRRDHVHFYAGGGSGSPAGLSTQIQYNSSGSFGADANLVWQNELQRMEIGGPRPFASASTSGINLVGDDARGPLVAQVVQWHFGSSNPSYVGYRANGTIANPTALTNGSTLNTLAGCGWVGPLATDFSSVAARIGLYANESWSETANGTRVDIWTTASGSTSANKAVVARFDNASGVHNLVTDTYSTLNYVLTIPATGMAALLGTANAFTAAQSITSTTAPQLTLTNPTGPASLTVGVAATTGIVTLTAAGTTPRISFANSIECQNRIYESQPLVFAGRAIKIVSPYNAKLHNYKGQLHCHTTNSDGVDTPAVLAAAYAAAGFDFLSITDHEFLTPDPGGVGVFIPGVEESATEGHIGRINATSNSTATPAQTIIETILADGDGIPILNHPNYPASSWTDAELESVAGYYGIEIWNSVVTPDENAEVKWDTLLTKLHKVHGFAVDDCHNVAGVQFNTGNVHVFADSLSAATVLDAIRRGNFYVTYVASGGGAEIGVTSVTVSQNIITVVVDTASTIEWIVRGGTVAQTDVAVTTASYTVNGDELYVRIRCTAGTKKAWTNPIYVDRRENYDLSRGGAIRGNQTLYGTSTIVAAQTGLLATLAGALSVNATVTLDANTANVFEAIRAFPTLDLAGFNATATTGAVRGFTCFARVTGSGTASSAVGGLSQVQNIGAGTITRAFGHQIFDVGNSGGGAVTYHAGLTINALSAATNSTSLLVGTSTEPAGNWGIYSTTPYTSYLAGSLALGTTTALAKGLTVNEAIYPGANCVLNNNLLEFDGSNDYVNLGNITELNSVANFSMSAWLNEDIVPTSGTDQVFLRNISATNGLIVSLTDSTNRLVVYLRNGVNTYALLDNYNTYVTAGRWHHLVITYDGTQATDALKLLLYIDGVAIAFTSFVGGGLPATTADMSAANAYISATSSAFDGKLKRFRIYNSTLTPANVLTLFQGTDFTTGLVHYYKLDEGTGAVATDTGSNPLNGAISGAAWTTSGYAGLGTTFPTTRLAFSAGTTREDGLSFGNDTWLHRSAVATLTLQGAQKITGAFACNNATPQTPAASGGALAAYATGAFGLDSDAHMSALHAQVMAMRAALVAYGMMS